MTPAILEENSSYPWYSKFRDKVDISGVTMMAQVIKTSW
jgi:hypothetical protein